MCVLHPESTTCISTRSRSIRQQTRGQRFPASQSSGQLPAGGAEERQSGARVSGGEMFLRRGQRDLRSAAAAGQSGLSQLYNSYCCCHSLVLCFLVRRPSGGRTQVLTILLTKLLLAKCTKHSRVTCFRLPVCSGESLPVVSL